MEKIYWEDIRGTVKKVQPNFFKLVDELAPDKSFPLFLACYPYGVNDADTISSLFPDGKGNYYRIADNVAPKDVVKHLGYSKDHTPLAMVLDKQIECFLDLKQEGITIPWFVYEAGDIFPFSRILNKKTDRIYSPNGLLSSTAGSRSVFMLPNIGCASNHSNLKLDFNVQCPPPKSLYDHWFIFKDIIKSNVIKSDWKCRVIYFSEKWVQKLHQDSAWIALKNYLHELAWQQFEYERNRIFYDISFSVIQKKRNLKPNPYLTDTAKHLFATALGATPGYAPAVNDHSIPVHVIEQAYVESYGLKKYLPTIIEPQHFHFETAELPVYYSLQNPTTQVFSPKSREASSTLFEMRELEHIMRIFKMELAGEQSMCANSVVAQASKELSFNYFHNKVDRHRVIQPTAELLKADARFARTCQYKKKGAVFASDAPFVRGCISISTSKRHA